MPDSFRLNMHRTCLGAGVLITMLGTAGLPMARAQTQITGSYTGAPGAHFTGPGSNYGGYMILFGDFGQQGYVMQTGAYHVYNATMTGGQGGQATGTTGVNEVVGGLGGSGLFIEGNGIQPHPTVTIDSGVFTGAAGGFGDGAAPGYIAGGDGGDGVFVDATTTVVNGGRFQGGKSGGVGGTSPDLSSQRGGAGMNANYAGTATIYGGDFIGGDAAPITNAGGTAEDGTPGSALELLGGSVSIYGGTFTPGGFDPTAPHGTRSFIGYGIDAGNGTATLYGSHFTVNGVANFTGAVPTGTGTITAWLQNNAGPTTITYYEPTYQANAIMLVATPEPSQAAGLGLGALVLGGLALTARRRVRQSA